VRAAQQGSLRARQPGGATDVAGGKTEALAQCRHTSGVCRTERAGPEFATHRRLRHRQCQHNGLDHAWSADPTVITQHNANRLQGASELGQPRHFSRARVQLDHG
jgi:hypothetical protein